MTNWKPFGIVSIFAGMTSLIGLIDGISIIFTSSIGIICGIIATLKGHKKLGWIGIILCVIAPLIFFAILYHAGWFTNVNTN